MTVYTTHIKDVRSDKEYYKIFRNEESAQRYIQERVKGYMMNQEDYVESLEVMDITYIQWIEDDEDGDEFFKRVDTDRMIAKMYITEDHVFR